MVNTPASRQLRGGDLTLMAKLAETLRGRGVEVTHSFEPEPDAGGADIAHVFNIRTVDATPGQVAHLERQGVPIALTPLYIEPSFATWAVQAVSTIFGPDRAEEEIEPALAALARRDLAVRRPDGREVAPHARHRPLPDYDRLQRETLVRVDRLLPNGLFELDALRKTLGALELPFSVVPEAVDPLLFADPDPMPFVQAQGLRDFVLQVGRIEHLKNQLLLAYALRDLDVPLVLIGDCQRRDYLDLCRRRGPKGLWVIPRLDPKQLRSAYAAAAVHALPSFFEACGLASLEAGLAGCQLVVGSAGYELEHFGELAYYCDPVDVASIRAAVERALERRGADADRRLRLKRRIMREHTWEHAAAALHGAYEATLAAR